MQSTLGETSGHMQEIKNQPTKEVREAAFLALLAHQPPEQKHHGERLCCGQAVWQN